MAYYGEVKLFTGNWAPTGWLLCDGSLLPISENETLFQLIGTTYGGDGEETFAVPDLRSRIPIGVGQGAGLSDRLLGETAGTETVALTEDQLPAHNHRLRASRTTPAAGTPAWSAPATGNTYASGPDASTSMDADALSLTGDGEPHPNVQPYQVINFVIAAFGVFPSPTSDSVDPYLAEMRLVAFNFPPKGWAIASGQILPINQNQALFSLLGTTYGGNGQTTFALPDLRGRTPVGRGQGPQLTDRVLGEVGGAEAATVTTQTMPPHQHRPRASGAAATTTSPVRTVPAAGGRYAQTPDDSLMDVSAVRNTGKGQPHSNVQPSLALTPIIALDGVFPSPN